MVMLLSWSAVSNHSRGNEQVAQTTEELVTALGIEFADKAPATTAASSQSSTLPTRLE